MQDLIKTKYRVGSKFQLSNGRGVLTAKRIIGKRNGHIVWEFECSICSKDKELWPEGSIASKMLHVARGKACCGCSTRPTWTMEQMEIRIRRELSNGKFKFIRWVDGFVNNRSKVVILCPEHGEKISDCHSVLGSSKSRCPECGNARKINSDNEEKVISVCNSEGYEYLGCSDDVPLTTSFYSINCSKHGVWRATVSSLLCGGNRCPGCSPGGFKPNKMAVVYFIESLDGKFIKIGISNKPKARMIKLSKCTPFGIRMVAAFRVKGIYAREIESELLTSTESAGLSGFDGATEWVVRNKAVKSWLFKTAGLRKEGQHPLFYGK